MKRIRTALQKTENSDVFFYTSDASEFLSLESGCVQIQMTLHFPIVNGIYSKCDSNKLFVDYLLFSVNQKDMFVNCPGMYAAFSNEGIVFSIWTKYGRFYIVDKISNLPQDEAFVIEFCWDSSGALLGSGATMAIFVDGVCTASGNFMFKNESISGINFLAIDSKNIDFNIRCLIHDFVCYSELPPFRVNNVDLLTNISCSDNEFIVSGRNNCLMWSENMNLTASRLNVSCSTEYLHQTISACDITGNLYIAINYNDGFNSGKVQKHNPFMNKIEAELSNLQYPICLSVIQKEGIDFPRVVYYDNTECLGVWVGSKNKLIKTNENLVTEIEINTFSEINSITCMSDDSCWISDKTGNKIYHVSYYGETLSNISITSPTFICSTVNDYVFVYSSSLQKVYVVKDGVLGDNISVGVIVGMDCNKNNEILLIAKSDGNVCSYNRDLTLRQSVYVCDNPSTILVRRGYTQDDFYLLDGIAGKVYRRKVSNLNNRITVYSFDKDILFNGSFFATAKNNGMVNFNGNFSMPFASGRSVVKNIKVYPYTVNKNSVDLSAGKNVGSYLDLKNIVSDKNPTDIQGGIIDASEITIGS